MRYLHKYKQHNEGIFDIFSEHKFKDKFMRSEFADKLSHYDIKAKQTSATDFDFYHNGRLIAYIRETQVSDVYYLSILVYLDEIIAPKSEYIRYPAQDQDSRAADIIDKQKVKPIGTTKKVKSRSISKLIEMLIEWWRVWSNSGKNTYKDI